MLFSVEKDSNEIIATIPRRGDAEKYKCTFSTCPNPVCTCGTVHLDVTPLRSASGNDLSLSPREIEIDIFKRKLAYSDKPSRKDKKFARKFLSELTNENFAFLSERHFEFKNKITNEADPDEIDGYFDFQEVEEKGLMYVYNGVMPYGDQIRVAIDGVDYILFDSYCVLAHCSCTDTSLVLSYADKPNDPDSDISTISLVYKTKKWKENKGDFSTISLEAIKSAVAEQLPDFYEMLPKRHRRLKAIYARCKEKEYSPQRPTLQKKVGRNAPCPCGSGKKYKKCCMN